MADKSGSYHPDQHKAHETPRSVRQTSRTTIFDKGPKHSGLRRNNRIPVEQQKRSERIGK